MLSNYTIKSRLRENHKARQAVRRRKRHKLITRLVYASVAILIIFAGCQCGKKIGEKVDEIKYPVSYSSYIVKYSKENNLDPYLVISVIKQESNFVADAKSQYAGGLMQLTEVTADEYAKKLGLTNCDYMDPETNIRIGCYVLSSLIEKYEVVDTALAAYNAGVGNVNSWLTNPDYSSDGKTLHTIPFSETRHYVKKVNHYISEYKNQSSIK